jgi:hypothetical protein
MKRTGATKLEVLKRERLIDLVVGTVTVTLFIFVGGFAFAGFVLGY